MKEIGRFPQVESFKVYGSIRELGKNSKIVEEVTLPQPILFSKSKPSTYLTGVVNSKLFLIVKNYFIEFLLDFNIGNHQLWNLKIQHRKKISDDYCLFHLSYPKQAQYVDYLQSDFYIGKRSDRKYKGKFIKIKNCKNYLSTYIVLYEEGFRLKCDRLIFNFSTATEDLFRLTDIPFGHGYYVSERLKDAMEKKRFTGMAFKEIEEYNKKIKVIY